MNWPGKKFLLFGIGRGFASLFSLSAHNRIVNFCNALSNLRVVVGERPDFKVSDENAVLVVPRVSSGAGGSGIALRCAVLSTSAEDTLSCIVLDGDSAGETITVARPPALVASVDSEVFDVGGLDVTVNYTYTNTQERTAASTGYVTHTQKIIRPYLSRVLDEEDEIETEGSIIYVMATASGGYIDLNVDAREWHAIPYIPVP